VSDELKLLVEWSSPWEEFRTAIRPAFMRSPRALAGEARTGLFPYRGILSSWIVEALLFGLLIMISRGLDSMRPYQPPPPLQYDVIYFSGQELPKTADAGGAQSGRSGRAGGREAHHPTQVIRVARGESVREKIVDAPKLNLPRSDAAVANLLAYKPLPGPPPAEGLKSSQRAPLLAPMTPIPPAPEVEHQKLRTEAMLNPAVVPPAPQVEHETLRTQPTLNSAVVPPAPAAQNLATLRLPGSHAVQVVPPPVSAPERMSNANPRLTLPAPAVVAPPPQIAREISPTGPGFGPGDLRKQVVPPPVQVGNAAGEQRAVSGLGNSTVVPPPVQMSSGVASRQPVSGLGGGTAAVPPPVQMNSSLGARQPLSGLSGGTAVVPPPPTVSGGASLTGRGRGNRGAGFGGPGELGDVAAPPSGGGSGHGTGIVVSNQPGSKVGVPGSGGAGTLAMSPSGGSHPGLGGTDGGTGIGRGKGSGSGLYGTGPGGGRAGSGHGSDPTAHGGISPFPGHGGTGSVADGTPAVPGVSVRGGTNVITLPSFGAGGTQPASPGRSSATGDPRDGITVVATSRSGGAFNFYGALKGDKVYTIYIDTSLGTAVMQFADPTSAAHPYLQDLTPPYPIRAELPSGLRHSRLVIACVLDRSGLLQNLQVIESAAPKISARILAALPNWKFRPALRGNQPVEVNALLGFDIDTSNQY
jgi:hypothetical protein